MYAIFSMLQFCCILLFEKMPIYPNDTEVGKQRLFLETVQFCRNVFVLVGFVASFLAYHTYYFKFSELDKGKWTKWQSLGKLNLGHLRKLFLCWV